MAELNIHKKDIDSIITNFGNHQRVCAFLPYFDKDYNQVVLYCRVDRVNHLPDPSIKDILRVASKDQDIKGNFDLIKKTEWNNNKCIDYFFKSN